MIFVKKNFIGFRYDLQGLFEILIFGNYYVFDKIIIVILLPLTEIYPI